MFMCHLGELCKNNARSHCDLNGKPTRNSSLPVSSPDAKPVL